MSVALWRRPALALTATLLPPLAWFVLIYLAALAVLFVAAFWSVDGLTGEIDRTWTLANFSQIAGSPIYRAIALRTAGIAAAVTVTDAVLAYPLADFMARVAGPKLRAALFTLVMLPLWSSYLARVDEVIVTTFTAGAQNTLPLWIFGAIRLGQRLPDVNVVVLLVTAITLVPVLLAYRLMQRDG